MGKHLRRLFSVGEVKEIFERYLSQEIGVEQALGLLKIRRRQFFKYHFEKYIPAKEELRRFKKENEGDALFSKGGFFYRLVPFAR